MFQKRKRLLPGNCSVSSLWPFSSLMVITHHLWYTALLIFRTVEAFDQIFHTSLGGTAAYYILDITLYFWKVSWGFIYWVINDRKRTSIFIIISKRTQSATCPRFESIAYSDSRGKRVIVSNFARLWGMVVLSHRAIYISALCPHHAVLPCHQTSSLVTLGVDELMIS